MFNKRGEAEWNSQDTNNSAFHSWELITLSSQLCGAKRFMIRHKFNFCVVTKVYAGNKQFTIIAKGLLRVTYIDERI